MTSIRLAFSERLVLQNAMSELNRHQRQLRESPNTPPTEPAAGQVVADLSQLQEVDTTALAVLLQLDRESRQRFGQSLRIESAPPQLRALARLSSVDGLMQWQV